MNTQRMLEEISRLTPGNTAIVRQVVEARQNESHTQRILECVLAIREGKALPKQLPPPSVVKAYLDLAKAVQRAG